VAAYIIIIIIIIIWPLPVYMCGTGRSQTGHINVFLTHFNNCNFSEARIVCSLRMVFFTPKHVGAF